MSAWVIGIGVGLIALQLTRLIANRVVSLLLGPPEGPKIAFASAVATGILVAVVAGRRLARKVAAT